MAPRGENRTKLIEATRALSLAKGFPATTVDEVCAEANVSKGSFYHHFETKEDVGHAALDLYFDELLVSLTAGPFHNADDAEGRLRGFLAQAASVCSGPVLTNGCLLGSFALDLAQSHPRFQKKLAGQFGELGDFVAELIVAAADEAGRTVPADRLAQQFLAIIEGSIVLAKAQGDTEVLRSGVGLFAHHLALLLDWKETP